MKNTIFISIDTERDQPIIIGKPPEITPPATPEEAKEMILVDINCVVEALCRLIDIANQNQYGDKIQLVDNAIISLNNLKILEEPKLISDEQ